jgi:cellulose biosynthesis protein BcsQ
MKPALPGPDNDSTSTVLSVAEIARLTGLSARTVNAKLSAAGINPVGRANRMLHYREFDVAPVVHRMKVASPYRIAIAHRKGGQAKTTTTFYLGRELAARGHRVILRDTDAQRSLTEVLDGLGAERDHFGRRYFLKRMVLVPEGVPIPFRAEFELIDTPPSLDDSIPGIRRADGLVVPVTVDFQAVNALRWMLEYLRATRHDHPDQHIIAVQPTRLFPRRRAHQLFLDDIRSLCSTYAVRMLDPIVEDASVGVFSMRGHLWSALAEVVVSAVREVQPVRRLEVQRAV